MAVRRGAGVLSYSLVASKPWTWVKSIFKSLKMTQPPRRDWMSYQAVKEYLSAIWPRYQVASKQEKSRILSEAILVCKLSRRQIRRQLSGSIEGIRGKSSGRPRKYDRVLLLPHVKKIWIAAQRVSAKRLKQAMLEDYLKFYLCEPHIKVKLAAMSVSTLNRFLRDIRGGEKATRGLGTTCPARYMKNKIPINTLDKKIDRPGYTQSDTVAHCGTTIAGSYAHSITLTDIDSTWTENRAIFTKKAFEVRKQFVDIKTSVPYKMLAINTDSGSEFLNTQILEFTSNKKITFTRSRPYKKKMTTAMSNKRTTLTSESSLDTKESKMSHSLNS